MSIVQNLGSKGKLYFFKLDKSLSVIKFEHSIVIPENAYYFNLIDGKFVFVKVNMIQRRDFKVLEGFVQINADYSLNEIENSGACLKTKCLFEDAKFSVGFYSIIVNKLYFLRLHGIRMAAGMALSFSTIMAYFLIKEVYLILPLTCTRIFHTWRCLKWKNEAGLKFV